MFIANVTLVGVGLLGGSIGLALKRAGLAGRVRGYVRRPESVAECLRVGAVDSCSDDLAEAVREADLVVLCTPVAQMAGLVERMVRDLRPGTVVTDVGSVKAPLVERLDPIVRRAGARFVGSHPLAGSERTGVSAARADLFEQAVCVVTPVPGSDAAGLDVVEGFWKALGGRVLRLDPAVHDALVGRSSHLPHAVSAALARAVLNPAHPAAQALLCATGFRDTTRVAAGSPEMWRDIALANAPHLEAALVGFIEELETLRGALRAGDEAALLSYFEEAKRLRDGWTLPRALSPE